MASDVAIAARDVIFISYSHKDRKWLDDLQIFLKPYVKQGRLKVWADPYIQVGDQWKREITAGLARACVGVVLVSQPFLASDFIQDEELPPLVQGAEAGSIVLFAIAISASTFKITPTAQYQWANDPDQPLDRLPRPKRNAELVRIVDEIEKAFAKVASASAVQPPAPSAHPTSPPQSFEALEVTHRMGDLHGVPSQRPNYIRRDDYFQPLKQTLLQSSSYAIGITGTVPKQDLTRIGLHGMGGIGKTVLAIDLVSDEEVRRAFPDGVFWLTLGQTPKLLELQSELSRLIAPDTPAFATVSEGRDRLRALFDGKSCLLVLDDLWRPQDASAFGVLGSRARLLTTTRDADLLVAIGASELPLDVLSEDLALELLGSWSGQPRPTLPAMARQVAASCGYLPLALALAGARVQGGGRWQDVLSALEQGRLEFLDHPYGSVFKSLRMSTDALPPAGVERYFELAVFPEDAKVPVETISILWRHTGRLEGYQVRDLLRGFARKALLTLDQTEEAVSFHDLQHDFLRLNIDAPSDLHATLVEAYRVQCAEGWSSGPDDGYFFQFLPSHLVAAGCLDELAALLVNYDWIGAKLAATDIQSLLADYDLVADDADLALVERALRLSAVALARDPKHLPAQLFGRLGGLDRPTIQTLLTVAARGPGAPWLCPQVPSLVPPGPLLRALVGHTGWVTAVAVLPDGRRALSGSGDNTLRLWDLETGESRALEGHTSQVTAVAVLPDGRRALSGSVDTSLRLWDLETGESRALAGHTDTVTAVAVLPDGRRVLSGYGDNTLRLWDLETGESRALVGHTGPVNAVAVLPDGRRALSGSGDNTLRLWDLETGESRALKRHRGWVTAVAVLPDGRRALSGSFDNTLRLWDLETGESRALVGHTGPVNAVVVLPDGRRALSGSFDKTLRLWDLETGESRVLDGHTGRVSAVAVLPDGRRALSGSWDNTLRLWDLEIGESRALAGHTGWVAAVAVLPDGRRALSGSGDNTLRLWDLETGESRVLAGHTGRVSAVAVLPDGRRALSGSWDNTLRLWDLEIGESRALAGHTGWVAAVAVLPDGRRALSGSGDNTLRLWDLETGESRALEGHTDTVTAVAVLPDGRRALSGYGDNTLRLWDLETGESRALVGHTGPVNAVAVLPDGRRALSGSEDNTLRLWDLETGESRALEGHTRGVTAVAGLPDGRRALSGSWDWSAILWDLSTAKPVAGFVGDADMTTVAASEEWLIAGSANGAVHVLKLRPDRKVERP